MSNVQEWWSSVSFPPVAKDAEYSDGKVLAILVRKTVSPSMVLVPWRWVVKLPEVYPRWQEAPALPEGFDAWRLKAIKEGGNR